MREPILNARLDMLEQELLRTNDKNYGKQKLCLKRLVIEDDDLFREWNKFTNLVADELGKQKDVLRGIRVKLQEIEPLNDSAAEEVLSQAWSAYGNALKRSQAIFREFLDFIGGLILLDKALDSEISEVPDEVIQSCPLIAFPCGAMPVPA